MKKTLRILSILLAMLLLVLPVQVIAATTLTSPATNLSATYDGDSYSLGYGCNPSASAGTASLYVKCSRFATKYGQLTLTNTGSETAQLSFSYTVSGTYGSCTIDGAAVSGGPHTFSKSLAYNESVVIYLQGSKSNEATIALSNIKLEVPKAAKLTVSYNAAGTVSVGGTTVTSGTTMDAPASGISLVATPNSGATFMGWVNATDNSLVSASAAYTHVPSGDIALKAIFASPTAAPTFWCSSKAYLFDDLSAAATHASSASDKTVTLAASGTLPKGDYTIPSGVTLLLPFNSDGTKYTTTPGYDENTAWAKPSAYATLTMANGANITVEGAVSVSAKVSAKMGYAGAPIGKYGHIDMNTGSTITVKSGANLYAWGYISGSGTVTIKSGGNVYESFQVVDWRGGTASSGMLGNSQKVFPMTQYYVQNVEAPMVLESGATENCSMVADIISVRQVTVPFIGSSGCMFNITSGSVTKAYDGSKDRLVLDVNGNFNVGETSIDLILTYKIDTKSYVLPVNSNVTININSGSTFAFNATVGLLPGAQVNIAEGGTLTVGEGKQLFVYDETEWKKEYYVYSSAYFRPVRYAHGSGYTRSNDTDIVDTQIVVNGTLDASAGYLYTTASGANICSTGKGIVKLQAPESSPTLYAATQSGTDISYSSISITAAQLKHGNGEYLTTGAGDYYYRNGFWHLGNACTGGEPVVENNVDPTCGAAGSYDSVVYCTVCNGVVSRDTVTVDATGNHNYESVVTDPTCTVAGYTTHTCTVCGDSYTDGNVAALGHTEVVDAAVAATCTTTGLTEGKHCSVCNEVLVAQNVVDALGHTEHVVAAVDATCTTSGLTEGKRCDVCGTITVPQTVVAALGHDWDTVTYEGDGKTSYTAKHACARCGEEETATANITSSVTKAATCTEEGTQTYTADFAESWATDKVTTETISKIPHSFTNTASTRVHTAATCHTYAVYYVKCDNCTEISDTVTVNGTEYDSNNHVGGTTDVAEVPAICDTPGTTAGTKCLGCGAVLSGCEEIPAPGHVWKDEWTKGEANHYKECNNCDAWFGIDAHTPETVPGREATCTEDGLTDGSKCSVCGYIITEQEPISAQGHTAETEWTHDELNHWHKCSVCGEPADESIAHEYENVTVTEPTHTTQGTYRRICKDCRYETKPIGTSGAGGSGSDLFTTPATGHGEMPYTAAKAATCMETGNLEYWYCAECNKYYKNAEGTQVYFTNEQILPVDENAHAWGDWVVTTSATCTAEGEKTRICEHNDEHTETQKIAKVNHTMEYHAKVDATCVAPGNVEYWFCSGCNTNYSDEAGTNKLDSVVIAINPDAHDLTEVDAKAPTCEEIGWDAYVTCTRCDHSTYEELPALEHDYEGVVTTEPTCTEAGVKTYTCKHDASHTYTEPVAALGHDEVAHEAQAPTCTDIGWDAYVTCTRCDYTTYAEKAALGHDEVSHEAKAPTCTDIGWDAYVTCTRCDYTTYAEKAALGHDEVSHEAQAPTCTDIGWDAYVTCSRCDYTTYAEKAALGHDEVAHEAQAPTCTDIGWDAYVTCSRCDYTTYAEKAALGHDEVSHEAQAPTCTDIGWDAYVTCSRCDYTTYAEKAALGHDEVAHEAQAPTCTDIGWDAYVTCTRCDYTTYVEKAALGHRNTETINVKAATCTEAGYTGDTFCNDCQTVIAYGTATALADHDYQTVTGYAATCTTDGLTDGVQCTVCKAWQTEQTVIPAAHTPGDAATCTTAQTCTACGAELVAKLDHSYGAVVTPPSCTAQGYTTYTCSTCSDSYVGDYIATVDHTYVDGACNVCGAKEPATENKLSDSGVRYQAKLIEPWALRLNVRFKDENGKTIPSYRIASIGVYFTRRSALDNPDSALTEVTMEEIRKGSHYTYTNGNYDTAQIDGEEYIVVDYEDGIYTYEMGDPVIYYFYYELDGILYHTKIREKNVLQLLRDGLETAVPAGGVDPRDVYQAILDLNTSIVAHRGDNSPRPDVLPPVTLADTTLGGYVNSTEYKCGASYQTKLIEPWGIRLNARIREYDATDPEAHLDYNSLDDYGFIVYHDKKNNCGFATAEDLLNYADQSKLLVYSKSNGRAKINPQYPKYVMADYDYEIYTWQLNSKVYFVAYIVKDGEYHYFDLKSKNIKDYTAVASEASTSSATEKAVCKDMIDLYEAITIYREEYFTKYPDQRPVD